MGLSEFKRSIAGGGELKFDPALHRYTIDGAEAIGTSGLLKKFGILKDIKWKDEEAMERGTRVHEQIALDLEGDLAPSSMTAEELGYVEAARKFRREHPMTHAGGEVLCGRKEFMAATLIDFPGELIERNLPVIVEWKTGEREKWHRLQVWFQNHLWHPSLVWVVYLRPDGTYEKDDWSQDYDAREATYDMLQAVGSAYWWQKRNS